MANKKISELTEKVSLVDDDLFPIVNSVGVTTQKVKQSTIISQLALSGIIFPGWIHTNGIYLDGTNIKIYPYVMNTNGIIYNSETAVTVSAIGGLTASTWYVVVQKESDGVISTIKCGAVGSWDNWTISGNQLNILSIFNEQKGYCRDSISGVFYRVLGIYKTNAAPDGWEYPINIPNRPKDYAIAESDTAQLLTSGDNYRFDYEDIIIDINSCVTVGASWKFEPSVNGIYTISHKNYSGTAVTTLGLTFYSKLYNDTTLEKVLFGGDTYASQVNFNWHFSIPYLLRKSGDYNIRLVQNTGNNFSTYNSASHNYLIISEM